MATYRLQIVSLDGVEYEGDVERIMLRSIDGNVAVLARHMNYCTGIGMGTAHVTLADGTVKRAACIGGMLSVMDGVVRVFPTTWEWDDDIDLDRARAAKERAEQRLKDEALSNEARLRAEAKLLRALVRIGSARKKNY